MSFKQARISANLTQAQVATHLNISRTAVSMWESGEAMPRADKLIALSKLYNCTVDDLLREKSPKRTI